MDLSGAIWRKASYSTGNGGACVEVAGNLPEVVAVRDSKDAGGPALVFPREAWDAFCVGVKRGEFGLS
jgi:Domain of unknown function (DUF397)